MRQVETLNGMEFWGKSTGCMSYVFPKAIKHNVWKVTGEISSCRSYIQDYRHNHKKEYPFKSIYIGVISHKNKKTIEKDIEFLHKKEKIAGLPKTRLYQTKLNGISGYIFLGNAAWNTCLWKISLYTYYIKKVVDNTCHEYDDDLKPYEDILLSKVKHDNYEKLVSNTYPGTHELSGFVTICSRKHNKHMSNHLLGEA